MSNSAGMIAKILLVFAVAAGQMGGCGGSSSGGAGTPPNPEEPASGITLSGSTVSEDAPMERDYGVWGHLPDAP